jgi:hypothetical protein
MKFGNSWLTRQMLDMLPPSLYLFRVPVGFQAMSKPDKIAQRCLASHVMCVTHLGPCFTLLAPRDSDSNIDRIKIFKLCVAGLY